MKKPRFFHDHGVVHDRLTGKHVCTAEHPDTSLNEIVDLLNSLVGDVPRTKGRQHRQGCEQTITSDCDCW